LTDTQGTLIDPTTGLGAGAIDDGTITVDPGSVNHLQAIYVGTGEANYSTDSRYGTGILKSTDSGHTWSLSTGPGNAFFGQSISKIIVDPTDPSGKTVYADVVPSGGAAPTADDQIYQSSDGGTTWTPITFPSTFGSPSFDVITDMDYTLDATGTDLTLFAAVSNSNPGTNPTPGAAIYERTNVPGGPSWNAVADSVDPALSSVGRRIALAANHTPSVQTVYAAAVQADGSLRNVYMTINNGGFWEPASASPPGNATGSQGWFDLALGLAPNGQVYLGGVTYPRDTSPQLGVYQLTNGNWTSIDTDANGHSPHTDFHVFAFDSGGAAYAGTDGGLYRYGVGWTDLNTPGLQTNELNAIALHPTNQNNILEGSQDNGTAQTTDGGTTWNTVGGGDGGVVRFDPNNIYFAYKMNQYGDLSRSSDAGATFSTDISPPSNNPSTRSDYPFQAPLAIDPLNSTYLLVGAIGTVWERGYTGWGSVPIGPNLTQIGTLRPDATAVTFAPSDDNTIYAAFADGRVDVTRDNGKTWATPTTPAGLDFRITDVVVDPGNPASAYVTVGAFGAGKVYHTADAGATWTDISAGLPNVPTNTVVLDPFGPALYVGNDVGVSKGTTTDGINWTWNPFNDGLPSVQVRDLQLQNYGSSQILAAATYGRGAWLATVYDTSGKGAIIGNGTIQMGINPTGNLNVDGGKPSAGTGTTIVGFRYVPTNSEVTAERDPAEGWGVADATSGVYGYANRGGVAAGVVNTSVVGFASTTTTARSVVTIGSTFQVTHDYHPAPATPNLYEVTVTIKNISQNSVDLRYRRVVDWDIEPTAYNEYVTIQNNSSTALVYDNNDGFTTANPLGAKSSGIVRPLYTGNFDTVGPLDQGALLDFSLGNLDPGLSRAFVFYYGADAARAAVLADLQAAGVAGYSLGQPSSPGGKDQGTSNTFALGFRVTAILPSPSGGGPSPSAGMAAGADGNPVGQPSAPSSQAQGTPNTFAPSLRATTTLSSPAGTRGLFGQNLPDLSSLINVNQPDGALTFAESSNQSQEVIGLVPTDLSGSLFSSRAKRFRHDALNAILLSAGAYANSLDSQGQSDSSSNR